MPTLPRIRKPALGLMFALLPMLTACGAIQRSQVESLLAEQQAAWNRGDMRGFIAGYWDDDRLTFSGASGITRGRADLLARYERGYPDAESRGRLTFKILDFRPIGSGAALVLGQYHLQRADPASGYWTLLVERTAQGIRVTHDHTSETPKDPKAANTPSP